MSTSTGLLTSRATSDRLGIDRSTLSRWVSKGRIKPVEKLPGLRGPFLFHPEEVARVEAELVAEGASA